MSLEIEPVSRPTSEAASLISELDDVLGALYEPEQRHGYSIEQIFQPNVRLFIARLGDNAVGCGAVAFFDRYAEVKRMYVRDSARGQGVADAILARIEAEVRGAGLSVLRRETGDRQVAAMRLYARAGFRACPAFRAYASMPPQSIATSVFFEKYLG